MEEIAPYTFDTVLPEIGDEALVPMVDYELITIGLEPSEAVYDEAIWFTNQLYEEVLERTPDPAGMSFWTDHYMQYGEEVTKQMFMAAAQGELEIAPEELEIAPSEEEEKEKIATYSGKIKPSGKLFEGADHYLEDENGNMECLLRSGKIDLDFIEGQSVEVEGKIEYIVEGDQQFPILEVEKVRF